MTDVKVNLTIGLQGGTMYSKQLCFKNSEITDKKGKKVTVETPIEGMTESGTFVMPTLDRKTGKWFDKRYTYHVRKCVPAKMVRNLSSAAYDSMVSASRPSWFRIPGKTGFATDKIWQAMSAEQRLVEHLKVLAADMNGELLDYSILDD